MQYELPDFDTLLGLAQNDPERLEQLRTDLTNQVIEQDIPVQLTSFCRDLEDLGDVHT